MTARTINKVIVITCFITVLILFGSCKTNSRIKTEANAIALKALDSLYKVKDYNIKVDVAYPFTTAATMQVANVLLRNTGNNASRVDVRGDGNFIKIQNDSVTGYLPFFGERRLNAGNYGGTDVAIQFEETLKNLNKEIDTKKGKVTLEFSAKQKGTDVERYDVKIDIYPNENVKINITPVYKTFMNYDGHLFLPKNNSDS